MADGRGGREGGRMHVVPVEVTARLGEPVYISVFSDLHLDSELCDLRRLREIADERRKLPGHRAIVIGDVADLVLPPDLRRFRPSLRPANIAVRDDYLAASIERCVEVLSSLGLQWDMIGAGNHEDEVLKRHGVDPAAEIARRLGCAYGGYSGVVRYVVRLGNATCSGVTIAYHHGAWGGKFAKGYNGAREWFDHLDGWDIAVYGHNHASRVDPEVRLTPIFHPRTGWRMTKRKVYLVNCSSFTVPDAYAGTHYTERKGYPPQPSAPPLIRVVWNRRRAGGARELGRVITIEV